MANFLSRIAQCLVSHASALPLPIPNIRYCISISVQMLSVVDLCSSENIADDSFSS
jgi:hypothetical protein